MQEVISMKRLLPKPIHSKTDISADDLEIVESISSVRIINDRAPPYGHRKNWVPRSDNDFSDGGAFPEIHLPQYPLEMGCKPSRDRNAIQLQLNEFGKPKYDAIIKQNAQEGKIIYSKYTDLLPKEITDDDSQLPQKPGAEEIAEVTEKTRAALERIISSKISSAMPVQHAPKQAPAQFIRYIPSQQSDLHASGAKQRIVRMVAAQKDPMSPPRFKINQKIPRGPPSPPVPVLHSPTRKVSAKEQHDWKIPPCISNWKNPKGYTIPLDKRLAADGRGLQSVHINEGFAKLAEALYIADREAREAIEMRAQLERKLAQKEKDRKEEGLRKLAEQARAVRAGVNVRLDDNEDVVEREELRKDRQKARQRERALQRVAPDKRGKLLKERERDITEKIALGLPNTGRQGGETQFDSRLFNMSKGLDSGFAVDDAYAVYDNPWREENAVANAIYRPSKTLEAEIFGDDIDKIATARKFEKHTDNDHGKSGREPGPVKFEKSSKSTDVSRSSNKPAAGLTKPPASFEDDDPFGLGQFFEQVKKTTRKTDTTDVDDKNASASKRKRRN